MWIALIHKYWQLCLFRETPEKTPYSPLLLVASISIFFFLVTVQWVIVDIEHQFTLIQTALTAISLIVSYAIYSSALLKSFKLSARFVQTLTCLVISHTIVHIIAFPLLLIAPLLLAMEVSRPVITMVAILYLGITIFLSVWQFMITTFIFKHALTINYLPATLASLGLLATNILVVSLWR